MPACLFFTLCHRNRAQQPAAAEQLCQLHDARPLPTMLPHRHVPAADAQHPAAVLAAQYTDADADADAAGHQPSGCGLLSAFPCPPPSAAAAAKPFLATTHPPADCSPSPRLPPSHCHLNYTTAHSLRCCYQQPREPIQARQWLVAGRIWGRPGASRQPVLTHLELARLLVGVVQLAAC